MSTKTVSLPWLFHGPHSRHVLIYPDCFTVSTVSQTQPVHVYWSRQQRVFGRLKLLLFLSADVQELIYMTSILDPWWPWSWIFKVIFSKSLSHDFSIKTAKTLHIWLCLLRNIRFCGVAGGFSLYLAQMITTYRLPWNFRSTRPSD